MELRVQQKKRLIMIKLWEKQFDSERNANYFYKNNSLLTFTTQLRDFFITAKISSAQKRQAILFCAHHFLRRQFEVNQYLDFPAKERKVLRNIYKKLFDEIEELNSVTQEEAGKAILKIETRHYRRLRHFLERTNPFYKTICRSCRSERLEKIACDEYSALFQLKIFRLQDCTIDEVSPLLDIGCGEHAFLVKYLRKLGASAYGFDRMQENRRYLRKSNWFEFNYGVQRWQTIISNLSFSSHFKAALCRNDGTHERFLKTYFDILKSLKQGGRWLYAPSLPEIEIKLSNEEYEIETFPVNDKDTMTSIRKLISV
jgi:hypothetical protein